MCEEIIVLLLINSYNSLSENQITSKGAALLFDTLRELDAKTNHVNLNGNRLDDACIEPLGEYIRRSGFIQSIDIGNNYEFERNEISDKGIEILSDYIIGTTSFKNLDIHGNYLISESSLPYLFDIAKMSGAKVINLYKSQVSFANQDQLNALLKTPIEERQIPIRSMTKSAAKRS